MATGSAGCIFFSSDGKREVRWMTRRQSERLSFIQRKRHRSKIYSGTQRGEKSVESCESLSEEATRGTSRWKWKRDELRKRAQYCGWRGRVRKKR